MIDTVEFKCIKCIKEVPQGKSKMKEKLTWDTDCGIFKE